MTVISYFYYFSYKIDIYIYLNDIKEFAAFKIK